MSRGRCCLGLALGVLFLGLVRARAAAAAGQPEPRMPGRLVRDQGDSRRAIGQGDAKFPESRLSSASRFRTTPTATSDRTSGRRTR